MPRPLVSPDPCRSMPLLRSLFRSWCGISINMALLAELSRTGVSPTENSGEPGPFLFSEEVRASSRRLLHSRVRASLRRLLRSGFSPSECGNHTVRILGLLVTGRQGMAIAVSNLGFAAVAHGERVVGQFPGINWLPIAVIDD